MSVMLVECVNVCLGSLAITAAQMVSKHFQSFQPLSACHEDKL